MEISTMVLKKFLIQTYNIGIIKKPVKQVVQHGITAGDITWLNHSYKDRYFADPFLIEEDDNYYYILVEEYIFWEEKGKITLLTIEKDSFTLVDKKVIIEEQTHLSFPFCSFRGDTIIPESVVSGKTKEYHYDHSRHEVTGECEILDEGLIDACFYDDLEGNKWIMAANLKNPKEDLYLYKEIHGQYKKLNDDRPVLSDLKLARSAGKTFTVDNDVYRPVQDCSERYGRQTIIVKLTYLDDNGYEALEVQTINSFENPPFNETLHTFNAYDNCIIIDGSKDYCRFPMKAIYKIRKRLK